MATEDDVREIALSLPASTEKSSYGTPAFRVQDKLFARMREMDAADGEVLVIFVADVGEKEALIASDLEKFFTVPHYDGHAMVLVRLRAVERDELTELLTESWLLRAPPKVAAMFLADHPDLAGH